jgi:hypothetical protein
MEYIKTLLVDHTPPHDLREAVGVHDLSLSELMGYIVLMFKDTDTGEINYIDCQKHNLPDVKPEDLIVLPDWLDSYKPRVAMFKYDDLSSEVMKYKIREPKPGDLVHEPLTGGDIEIIASQSDGYTHNTLFTVGDLIHETNKYNENTYFVIDSVETARRHEYLGKVYLPNAPDWDVRPLDATMLRSSGDTYNEDLTIELTTAPGDAEIPVFVIAGTLVFLGDGISRIDSRNYRFDLNNTNFYNRLIDRDGVVAPSAVADDIVDLDMLKSNEYIDRVFDASQTFVIFIKAESIHVQYPPAPQSTLPGKIVASKWQYLPMVNGHNGLLGYSQRTKTYGVDVLISDDRIKRYMRVPNTAGVMSTGIDPTDIVYRRTCWQATYVRLHRQTS